MAEMIASTFGEDIKKHTGIDILEVEETGDDDDEENGLKVTVGKHLSERMTVKYAVESKDGEIVQRAISEYKLLENILVSGFQGNDGVYGSELTFRIDIQVKLEMDRKPGKIWIFWLWAALAAILLYALPAPAAQDASEPVQSKDTVGTGMSVAGIQIIVKSPPDRIGDNEALARQLISIAPGDPLTRDAIQTSIESLRLSNRFAAIDVDSRTTPEGEILMVTLTPHQTIEDIRIHGNEPIFEADILNQMTLYPGDPFTEQDLSGQEEAVIKRYKKAGYIDPKVSVEVLPHDAGGNAVIVVDITKGPHYRLGRLTFEGRRGLSEGMLKLHMRVWRTAIWPTGRFSRYWLKKDVDNLLAYYRRKGFADAALSYRTALAEDGRHVDVVVSIDEGPRYKVSFEDHHRFWTFTLKKDVAIYSVGNRGKRGVRKTVSNIRQRYHNDGFLEARVEAKQTPVPDAPIPTNLLQFVIHEGPQTKVESVQINGNHSIEEKKIKKQMLTRPPGLLHDGAYKPETLEEDVFAVRTLYMREGFQEEDVNARADVSADKTRAKVNMEINEGPRTRVESITIEGLTIEGLLEEEVKTRLAHKVGEPFRRSALEADKQTIASLVSEKGHPYVTGRGQEYVSMRTKARQPLNTRSTPARWSPWVGFSFPAI